MLNLSELYLQARAEGTRAAEALSAARYRIKHAGRKLPGYAGDSVRIDLPRGEYINLKLESDNDADIEDRLQCTFDESERHDYASLGWIDRGGRVYADGTLYSSHFTPGWWTDDYGFDQFWQDGKRQHSRHAAWLRARELVRKTHAYYCEVLRAGYVGYVVTLHDAKGKELDSDSCWGFEATGDYAAEEGWHVADSMREERAAYWETQVAKARERMAEQRSHAHALVGELKKLRHIHAPTACAELHNALRRIRYRHSTALRVVTG